MTPANLKAVDQVVKIVRELDRYGGAFVAAARRRPRAVAGLEAPAEGTMAFGAALVCRPEFPLAPTSAGRAPAPRPASAGRGLG